ncbi:VOC family protein [Halobellus rufus]|uniref:VOC family protein n=1 Tax=Halobellus rufus TaxID=1448860 RepID=UPI0006797249|nr:VOC family protein [Halobellus rufus]
MSELTAHHVGVTVDDLERSVAFYRDTLGLPELARFTVGGEAFAKGVGIEGAEASFVHLDGGDVRIELVSYESTGGSPDGTDDEGGAESRLDQAGATHIGLTVDDVVGFYDSLSDDVETISRPQTTESGTTIFFVRDPEGNLVEVLST